METDTLILSVDADNLPTTITDTVNKISEISSNIIKLTTDAESVKTKAEEASQKEAGFSLTKDNKKEAIIALQDVMKNQAEILLSFAEVNQQLFENQTKMAKAIKYLFGLGVKNIAANRIVIDKLESTLKNASKHKLDDLAKQEIKNVILQLRAQQDIFYKLDQHDKLFIEHKTRIQSIEDFKNNELSQRSFVDSKIYKVTIGLIAIISIVISILNILF